MEITQNKKIIYFADLTHIINGVHTPTFPLGVSYVASYAKERLGANYEIRLFRFPDDLAKTIIETPPNVIALSNYSWNLELSYELCSWAKKLNPNLISVFGGPNFPIVQQEKTQFLNRYKNIDFFIELEGEIGFVGLMKKLEIFDFDTDKLKKCQESINNCTYLSGSRLITGLSERIKDLNEIPSPYLTGMLDSFFDYPLLPMMEKYTAFLMPNIRNEELWKSINFRPCQHTETDLLNEFLKKRFQKSLRKSRRSGPRGFADPAKPIGS